MSRFVYRPEAERILARQPGVVAAVTARTRQAENEAEKLARPVSARFADGVDGQVGVDENGAVGRVNANWWGSLFVEFGTKDQPPQAILRRALDAARGTLR